MSMTNSKIEKFVLVFLAVVNPWIILNCYAFFARPLIQPAAVLHLFAETGGHKAEQQISNLD